MTPPEASEPAAVRNRPRRTRGGVAVAAAGVALAFTAAWAWSGGAQSPPNLQYAFEPPDKIVTAESCGECHLAEYEVWQTTTHATGFRALHRTEAAEAIADKMGLRLLKRDSICLQCHYTPTVVRDQLRAASGVSCESCHGAGEDWIDIHNDYGKGADYRSETAEHRRQRIEASVAAGMNRPSDLYDVATTCYRCHTVPEEELVNVGGHTTGSVGFELVERSQGKIRHNFLAGVRGTEGAPNRERTLEEKRPLYVVGRTVALEYSLRGLAKATENGAYSRAMSRRYQTALREVQKIDLKATIPEVREILQVASAVRAVPNQADGLNAAADKIGEATRRFLGRADGAQLAALDNLVLGILEPELEFPDEEEEVQVAEGGATGPPAAGGTGGEGATGAAGGESGSATPASTGDARPAGRPAVGTKKRRIRPRSQHRTLGAAACGGCHEGANTWWAQDAHAQSAQPFFSRSAKNTKIALLYGVKVGDLTKGNQICMDCHGTVVTGSEAFDVFDGVSCESCHGPANDFLEPHKEGDKALGTRRPGYVNALQLGMVELKNLNTRARTCTGCHYITDPRLISSGHPSGKGFDYVAGMAKINHWEDPAAASGALTAAFRTALGARGAVPQVQLGELPPEEQAVVAQIQERSPRLATATGASWNRPRPVGPSGGRGSAAASGAAGASGGPAVPPPVPIRAVPVTLPPFPEVEESATIEDLLLLIKNRLEDLYRAIRQPPGGDS